MAAGTSSFRYSGNGVAADSIGRALHVAHLVEGSVQREGDQLRITVRLVDAAGGAVVPPTLRYDRELTNVLELQDEICRDIAAALRVQVSGPLRTRTVDPEAYDYVSRARQAIRRGGNPREYSAEAERLFQEAVARDPSYAEAHAELAYVHRYQAYEGFIEARTGYAWARQGARQALAHDPNQPTAHFVLALIAEWYEWDYAAAERHYRRALDLNPNDPRVHSNYGWLLMRLGRREEALGEGRRAVELDPLAPNVLSQLGTLYALAGDYERAVAQYLRVLGSHPGRVSTLVNLAQAYSELGRHPEAVGRAEEALASGSGYASAQAVAAYVYTRAGRRAEAERLLATMERASDVSPYKLAIGHVALGERDRALALLEQAVEERDSGVADLGMNPAFAPLRGDPRMDRLLEHLGLRERVAASQPRRVP